MKKEMLLAAGLAVLASPALAETVVVTADRMLDVQTGRYVAEPVIVITDGRIAAVTARNGGRPNIPEGAKRIDLPGKTILPGLIDMHVHLDANPNYGGYTGLQFTDQFWTVQGVGNATAMLDAGFTTVRNVGSENYSDVAYKQAIDEGLMRGPRIVPAAHPLSATGGHCDSTYLPPSFNAKGKAVGDGAQELRTRVREQRKYGAEVIKVCATGGVFSRNTEPGQQQLSEEELRAIADEAHQWGLRTAAHAHGAAGIKAAIRAGIDTIEHVSLVDDEGIRLALDRKRPVWFAMDIFNTEYTQREGRANGVLEDNLRKDREVAQIQRDNFRKAHRAGVRMVFATDAGVMPHGTAAGQFRIMVEYGMTPAEAIRSATWTAAEALGRERDVGAIAVGRYGDIVAVDGDPLADVSTLEKVAAVIKGGELVKAP
ncbi:metal-dependent hydrolase family protein [Allosphingosinicella indica]|uniref:Imidazolonepropionase n=1 Tax=Allosphingosinicella indica TaxID=941907 RepID=A0A1X7G5T6_9SPHN|nr:amidohydrolase family protein [Allosphingosinicella indica]SMF64448.1 Imidazolonepropionase [Allosphingosinicella indica]